MHMSHAIATKGKVNTRHEALGQLWVSGVQIEWPAVFDGSEARAIDLPMYQFQRRKHWLDPPSRSTELRIARHSQTRETTTGHSIIDAMPVTGMPDKYESLSLKSLRRLADHIVGRQPKVPATVLADLALYAGRQTWELQQC